MQRWAICLLSLLTVRMAAAAPAHYGPPSDLDAYVARSLRTFHVPGMSLAIVKDGRVVLQKGYGVRELGEPARVDADTVFGIGSNTKAFTTAALAILVDAGKLSWDDPVYAHLTGFQMYDAYVSREMRIRDMVSHRGGLGVGEGDLMLWPRNTYTRDDLVFRLRFLKPVSSFRSQFAYNNLMFVAAGQVVAQAGGKSWDDYLHDNIFVPLGMKNTNSSASVYPVGGNWALPHSEVEGKLQVVPILNLDNAAAAGSINSSAADMARWLLLQLGHGKLPGSVARVYSDQSAEEMWKQESIIPIEDEWTAEVAALRPHFVGYAKGWFLRDYKGRRLVGHPGGLTGYVSRVLLVPEENLGVVVLTNAEKWPAFESVLYHILDSYLGGPTQDYIEAFKAVTDKKQREGEETEHKAQQERAADSKPSLGLDKYAGEYSDPWFGKVLIQNDGNALKLRLPLTQNIVAELQHWQFDTFKARWNDRKMADAYLTFALKPDGSIDHFTMAAVSPLADFSADYQDLYFTPVPSLQKQ